MRRFPAAVQVQEVLMPCMFEDLYRMDTGEKEQIREICGYHAATDSYPYEMIFSSPYPPFGEVVDARENPDGTLTLFADEVWPDYDSDCAFINTITVLPFDDGTFRYLSNSIEKRELDIPAVYRIR